MHHRREIQSLHIHRRIAERLLVDPEPVIAKATANLDAWLCRHHETALEPVYREWREIIASLSPRQLAEFIISTDERSTRMRQSSPFAGVLTPAEIWAIKRDHAAAST